MLQQWSWHPQPTRPQTVVLKPFQCQGLVCYSLSGSGAEEWGHDFAVAVMMFAQGWCGHGCLTMQTHIADEKEDCTTNQSPTIDEGHARLPKTHKFSKTINVYVYGVFWYLNIYIYIYIYTCIYIYIYIERERERYVCVCIYVYIYIYIYRCGYSCGGSNPFSPWGRPGTSYIHLTHNWHLFDLLPHPIQGGAQ